MKLISCAKSKWAKPRIRNLTILGGLLIPISMVGAQLIHVPGTHPHNPFAALFLILTLPGQIVAGALDPIFGYRHRQSAVFVVLFLVISILTNAFVFGAIGVWWDKKRNEPQNKRRHGTR